MSASSGTLRAKLPIAPPRSVFGATEGHPDTIQNDVGLYHMLYVNFLTALLLCLCSSPLHSAVVFSESVNGPLSSSGNTPTILSLSPGSNNLISSFGGSAQYDYFSFTLASGQTLTSLKLDSYVSTDAVAQYGNPRWQPIPAQRLPMLSRSGLLSATWKRIWSTEPKL